MWSSRIESAPKENYNQLLYDATVTGDPEHVSRFLALGAVIIPIGKKRDTALHVAARLGMNSKLEVLTKVVGDVDVKDSSKGTPLHYAAAKGHKQCLVTLLNHPNQPKYKLSEALEAR